MCSSNMFPASAVEAVLCLMLHKAASTYSLPCQRWLINARATQIDNCVVAIAAHIHTEDD